MFILLRKKRKKKWTWWQKRLWQYNGPLNGPLAKISMLKSLEIKGFIGGNIQNEIRYCKLLPFFHISINLHNAP